MVLVSFKIVIFGQDMAKKLCACPYLGIRFFTIWAEYYGYSVDYYLSIGGEKSKL